MQTEQDWDTVSVGTQTEPQVVSVNQESVAGSMKCCEGIVDVKYASLISKYDGLFKDAQGKQQDHDLLCHLLHMLLSQLRKSGWLRR